ncbi:hypothetical protein [Methylocucumis oryzae]|uniref:Uncharacterized protein n=1 Tax=Methylocucumis oryzae TaxID=1632867 RepID=A0A0F3IGU4_9GAMM|nr:hypothetical protein [Methylocucumis oryzae]KJV05981.1 hypothetical protein VZ94_14260 [Methylocucumis oryzae]
MFITLPQNLIKYTTILTLSTIPTLTSALQVTGSLGEALEAVDVYSFTCPSGTTEAKIRVIDLNTIFNSAAVVYASFGKDSNPTLTVFDSESTSTSSAWISNSSDGSGTYGLVVRKNATNSEDYGVEALCLDSTQTTVLGPRKLTRQINQ